MTGRYAGAGSSPARARAAELGAPAPAGRAAVAGSSSAALRSSSSGSSGSSASSSRSASSGQSSRGARYATPDESLLAALRGILGELLADLWDARYGYVLADVGEPTEGVDAWYGQHEGNLMQALGAAQRPTYEPSAVLGRPAVAGNGVDQGMACMLDTPIPTGSRPYAWIVVQCDALIAGEIFFHIGTLEDPGQSYLIANLGLGEGWGAFARGSGNSSTDGPAADASAHVIEAGYTQGSIGSLVVDGAGFDGSEEPGPCGADLVIAHVLTAFGLDHASAMIAAVVLASDEPTTEQRAAVRAALASEWGLS